MNKRELIEKIAHEHTIHKGYAEVIVNAIDVEGWLRNPGEPIDPKDIRQGDRLRRVRRHLDETDEVEYTAPNSDVRGLSGCRYFLLDRPMPGPTEAEKMERDLGKWRGAVEECVRLGLPQFLADQGWTKGD